MGKYDTKSRLDALNSLLEGKSSMLIVMQGNPDPDGLASAMALRTLVNARKVNCSLACGGTVGRAENRALARYADLNLHNTSDLDPARYDLIAMVDAQPGQRKRSVSDDFCRENPPDIVIDHHPIRPESRRATFTDIRGGYGATATILYEYLQAGGIEPDAQLATALLYGIRSDTQDFERQAKQADIDASNALYALANKRMLGTIQRGRAPLEYFRMLAVALENARRCGKSIYSALGQVENADMIAEVADLLLRYEEADWSLCWAYLDGMVQLSVRTLSTSSPADMIVRKIVSRKGSGGGHRSMAAGQIPFRSTKATDRDQLDKLIRKRFLDATGTNPARCRRVT